MRYIHVESDGTQSEITAREWRGLCRQPAKVRERIERQLARAWRLLRKEVGPVSPEHSCAAAERWIEWDKRYREEMVEYPPGANLWYRKAALASGNAFTPSGRDAIAWLKSERPDLWREMRERYGAQQTSPR